MVRARRRTVQLGYSAGESKTERASRSRAHCEHDGVLGEGEDGRERPGHGEVSDGGASTGSEEEDVVRWRWTARDEASRPGRSGRARRRYW